VARAAIAPISVLNPFSKWSPPAYAPDQLMVTIAMAIAGMIRTFFIFLSSSHSQIDFQFRASFLRLHPSDV
jgi:hypothetical protein